jgi:multimeric flavodoxin WrbA
MRFNEYKQNREKKKVVLVIGSPRFPGCCPDEKSKTHKIAERLLKDFADLVKFETVDLAVKCDGLNIQPCKACISTSAFHCHWPCDCYGKKSEPKDLMHEQDVYTKLEQCDAFMVLTPINWSSCSSVVKSFFDRLVCANLTITTEQAQKLMDGETKSSKKSRAMEKDGKHERLLKNHLEGKRAAFFAHGNAGGADYREISEDGKGRPEPESLKEYEERHGEEDQSKILEPLVRQCVYSGIHIAENCVKVTIYGKGITYSDANDLMRTDERLYREAEEVLTNLLELI